jgi:small GTP-binding protein
VNKSTVNRAILLTPPGAAAIAVVRLTGDKTTDFLQGHFSRPIAPGRAVHGKLTEGTVVIDDPLVVLLEDGCSADISLHGGPWVVRQALELAKRAGFEIVQSPGFPLTGDAVDGDDEYEREMLALLPLAKTELALRCLLAQPTARRRWRPRRGDRSLWWLLHPPGVAIVGAPNVGKSTLANQLFARERSITADQPGTTRDWVGEIADLDGLAVFLMDTPGRRESSDAIEQAAIAASDEPIRRADLIVLVVDAMQSITEQRQWIERYPGSLVVRNKCDRTATAQPIDAARPHIYTVATASQGIDALRQAIRRHFLRPWRHPRRAMKLLE